jgi:hypothetical protein
VWQATVRVDQSVKVSASPEAAWSLLSGPLAWSARAGGCLTFDVADPRGSAGPGEGSGRVRFLLAAGDGRPYATILEVTGETPGQQLCLQTSGGRATWVLSVEPGRGGTRLGMAATWTVGRAAKIDAEAELRREVKDWLAALRDIADGHRPRPGDGMPEELRQACLASPPPGPAAEASASVEVGVPLETFRRLLGTADLGRALQPASVLWFGQVPGTPAASEVGGMRFNVRRRPDGLLAGRVSLLAAVSPGGRVVRLATPPFDEMTFRYESAGPGTRLELTQRHPGQAAARANAGHDQLAALVIAAARQYKDAIERLAGAGG